jgi:hypothetical protein
MSLPDGRFGLEEARVALRVLSTIDPSLRSSNVDLGATFTNAFVDKAHATIVKN